MGGDVYVIGISWRTAPVAVREKLAFRDDELIETLKALREQTDAGEAMLLSTCNRVEIYAATPRTAPGSALVHAAAATRSFLAASRRIDSESLAENLYEYVGDDAVRHVFRVASALDSLVVGEAQILGQLKSAFGVAHGAGTTGAVLTRCLERAFGVAKRVRTETGIARGAANVSSVAVELARHVFVDLSGKTVLVVGAGKMSALAVRHLRNSGVGTILVTNRSPEKAEALADEVDGVARPWDQLPSLLAMADVVISSTGAQEPILTKKLFKGVVRERRYRPIVVIDIAVPRDAETRIADYDGVFLFDIDDLQRVVSSNLEARAKEADAALRIVEAEAREFRQWQDSQRVVPVIRALRDHFVHVAEAEVERVVEKLAGETSPEAQAQAVRRLGQLIVNKLLHQPMVALKDGSDPNLDQLVGATERLFGLDGRAASDESTFEPATALTEQPSKPQGPS